MTTLASIVPGLLAIAVSAYALYVSSASARRARDEDTVRSSYDEFEQISHLRMEHWRAVHLFEMPENYELAKGYLITAVMPLTEAERSEMLLCERSIAIAIFDVFEETYYHRERAEKHGDSDRVVFLDTVLAYFTGRLLANPRLRWLWSPSGGNLRAFFEVDTICLYDEALPDIGELEVGDGVDQVDPTGPYLSESGRIKP